MTHPQFPPWLFAPFDRWAISAQQKNILKFSFLKEHHEHD